ncbi:MAG TPA: hypothetical protein VNM24_08850, partial [Burkholderiales bacterium]|nr:hypothetical protein [Burkholderiales bacterium]
MNDATCYYSTRQFRIAILLLMVVGLLNACGGGDADQAQGSVGVGTATLAWDPVTDPNLAGYRIYYGT